MRSCVCLCVCVCVSVCGCVCVCAAVCVCVCVWLCVCVAVCDWLCVTAPACVWRERLIVPLLLLLNSTPGKRNVVVAHSFGCVLAARLAAHASCKDQVAGVVLVGAAYDQPPGTMHPVFRLPVAVLNWLRARMGAAFVANAFASGTDTVEYRRGGVWGDVCSPCATVRGCQALIEAECKKTEDNQMHMVKAFYRQMQWRCHDALPAIKVPVLLITGAEDKITPVVQAEKVRHCVGMHNVPN